MNSKILPVSEVFTSPQGEGLYAGTMMTFIRLAGCTVGKPFAKADYAPGRFPIYTEKCTLYDGRTFACDTDYRVKERLRVDELITRLPKSVKHVCISGGEPVMHKDLDQLAHGLVANGFRVHIETSGTILMSAFFPEMWLTVAPKKDCLDQMIIRADEIKLLVDDKFDIDKIPRLVKAHDLVYLHPVNFEHEVNSENLKRVMKLQEQYPNFRIGLQMHKAIEHFIKERVR